MKTFKKFGIFNIYLQKADISTCLQCMVKKPLALLFFLGCGPLSTFAQTLPSGGLVFDDETYRQFPRAVIQQAHEKEFIFPRKVSLKVYAPYPQSQGESASCVGWAVGYGAMTILRAIDSCITDRRYITNELSHSAAFIYNQIKLEPNCRSGASLPDAFRLLYEQGVCLEKTFLSIFNDCLAEPDAESKLEARQFQLEQPSFRLYNSDDKPDVKIKAVAYQLARQNPVIVGFATTPEPAELLNNQLWLPEGKPALFGHAMDVTGYDQEAKTFEVMNSFGLNWAQEGFVRISYTDFAKYARQAWVVREAGDQKSNRKTASLKLPSTGQIELLAAGDEAFQDFVPVGVESLAQPGWYKIHGDPWKVNENLVRVRMHVPAGRHAYLLNIDTHMSGHLLFHFPDQPRDTTIVFPENAGLRLSTPGLESLCLLVSHEPVANIAQLTAKIPLATGEDPYRKIRHVFRELLVPAHQIRYYKSTMGFQARTPPNGAVGIPVVLSIEVVQ